MEESNGLLVSFGLLTDDPRWYIVEDGKLVEIGTCEGCKGATMSRTGMCYQCECEAHADGWFDQDTGYARM